MEMTIRNIKWEVSDESTGYAIKHRDDLAWPYTDDAKAAGERREIMIGLIDRCRSTEANEINACLARFAHYATVAVCHLITENHARGERYERAADRELVLLVTLPCHEIEIIAPA
jgi:hypothetical protein